MMIYTFIIKNLIYEKENESITKNLPIESSRALTRTNSLSRSRLYTLPISSPSKASSIFDTGYASGAVITIIALVMTIVFAPTAKPCREHMACVERQNMEQNSIPMTFETAERAKIGKIRLPINLSGSKLTYLWRNFTEHHNQ